MIRKSTCRFLGDLVKTGGSILLLLMIWGKQPLVAQHAPTNEYQVKAVFLFNFTKFITWPAAAFNTPHEAFVIGIMGTDPFGPYLDETLAGETAMERPIVVKRNLSMADIGKCHLLYIGSQHAVNLQRLLQGVPQKHTLTVSDLPGFTRHGGIIGFTTINNKIRLSINAPAAQQAELTISSKLLRLAAVNQ